MNHDVEASFIFRSNCLLPVGYLLYISMFSNSFLMISFHRDETCQVFPSSEFPLLTDPFIVQLDLTSRMGPPPIPVDICNRREICPAGICHHAAAPDEPIPSQRARSVVRRPPGSLQLGFSATGRRIGNTN